MYQNVPLPKKTALRLPKIKEGLCEGLNYDQIAANCGLKSSQTIDRDMKAWIESGLFEIWLITEYIEAHYYMKKADKRKVYDNLSHVVSRMVTQKREVKEEYTETQRVLHLHMWRPGDEPADKPNKVPVPTIREASPIPQRPLPDKT